MKRCVCGCVSVFVSVCSAALPPDGGVNLLPVTLVWLHGGETVRLSHENQKHCDTFTLIYNLETVRTDVRSLP